MHRSLAAVVVLAGLIGVLSALMLIFLDPFDMGVAITLGLIPAMIVGVALTTPTDMRGPVSHGLLGVVVLSASAMIVNVVSGQFSINWLLLVGLGVPAAFVGLMWASETSHPTLVRATNTVGLVTFASLGIRILWILAHF